MQKWKKQQSGMSKSIELTLEEVETYLESKYTQSSVENLIDEAMGDYLDPGWEGEFETEYDAYQEQGHGEAEDQITTEICNDIFTKFYPEYPHTNFEQRQLLHNMYDQSTGEELSDTIKRLFEILDV